jgi:hypothetical protein
MVPMGDTGPGANQPPSRPSVPSRRTDYSVNHGWKISISSLNQSRGGFRSLIVVNECDRLVSLTDDHAKGSKCGD